MGERKWGLMTSGATFQALVNAILGFEDPTARGQLMAPSDGPRSAPRASRSAKMARPIGIPGCSLPILEAGAQGWRAPLPFLAP